MGEGLKRAIAVARATRKCSVYGCKRVRRRHGHLCKECQRTFDAAVDTLLGRNKEKPAGGNG